jgi:uncharacterized protein (DUF433 family)
MATPTLDEPRAAAPAEPRPGSLDAHIVSTPGIVSGRPRIAGHRISVQNIMIWHEQMGRSAEEIAADYNLTLAEVYAALAYYYDHREEIDDWIRRDEELVAALEPQARIIYVDAE